MCLCAIPLFSLPLAASADNSLLIFHGDYGGGSSTHGVSHVLKYDKVNNVYYVTRQSYGIMNKVSGTAFETQGMKDSTKNLADAISSRKEKLAAETDQRTASDDAIRAKIDGSLVLTYDSNAHDTITLGGEGGTLLSHVKGDASDASSLANGGQLFDLAASHENRESLAKETAERKSALEALEKDANERLDREATYITDTGARVAALSSLRFGDYRKGQKSSFALSLGGYQGERAAAIGGKYYFNRDSAMNAGTTLGNKKMSNLGVSFRIRMDTPELLVLQSIKEEMLTLYDDNEKLQEEILKLKEKGDDPA